MEAMVLLLRWSSVDLDITDTGGGTALHSACSGDGQPEAVKLLLMTGLYLQGF